MRRHPEEGANLYQRDDVIHMEIAKTLLDLISESVLLS